MKKDLRSPKNLMNKEFSGAGEFKRPLNFGKFGTSSFTLAEVMTVVVILGIIAAIIIPATLRRQSEIIKRTTIKKALAAYNTAVEKIVVEQGLRSEEAINSWAKGPNNDCAPVREYFKVVETAGNGCQFRTADKLWWDMGSENAQYSSLTKTFVAFKQNDLTWVSRNKVTLLNNSDAFAFTSTFDDNGTLRIYDLSYALSKCDRSQLMTTIKLQHFLNKTKNFDDSLPKCKDGRKTSCYAETSTPGKYNIMNGKGEACYMIETTDSKNVDPFVSVGSGVPVGSIYGDHWCFTNEYGGQFCDDKYGLASASYCDVSALSCDDAWVTLRFSSKNPAPPDNYITVFNKLGINLSDYNFKAEAYIYGCRGFDQVSQKSANACTGQSNATKDYIFRTGDSEGASAVTITIKPSGNRRYQYSTSTYSKDCTTHPGCYYNGGNKTYCCDAEFQRCSAKEDDPC